jgi:hypothetical protein
MRIEIKRDIVLSTIIASIAIIFLYLQYFIFNNFNQNVFKNIFWDFIAILLLFFSIYYFKKSKNNFIVKNIIYIITNFVFLLIGFDFFYIYVFKFYWNSEDTTFFSINNFDYLLYLFVLILIVSILLSSLTFIIKKIYIFIKIRLLKQSNKE